MTHKQLRYGNDADGEPLHYKACGLDDVYLLSGYERHQTAHGDGVSIKDMDALHRAIGRRIVCEKSALNGKEIRFLRKHLDMTQEEFARYLSVTGQTVQRWEQDKFDSIGAADGLIRLLFLDQIGALPKDVRLFLEKLAAKDDRPQVRRFFTLTRKQEWVPRSA